METCKYGLGAGIGKPTVERPQGVLYRAYGQAKAALLTGVEFVGGILGVNYSECTADYCVALNKEVRAMDATTTDVGRVAGGGYGGSLLVNCYARSAGMILRNGSGNVTPTLSLTGKDGSDVSEFNTHGTSSGSWWTNTLLYNSTLWSVSANRLPWLKTTTGAAFNQTQNPTVQ